MSRTVLVTVASRNGVRIGYWSMAKISTVGAIAATYWPTGDSRMRRILPSGSGKPSKSMASMSTSESTPCRRSFSLVLKPAMTLLTTISVATPSMTLTMQTSAR